MENLLNYSLANLQQEFKDLGVPAFRAKQIFKWVHSKLTFDFDKMTDLSKELRALLQNKYCITLPKLKKVLVAKDKTRKYLFVLEDGSLIESVLMQTIGERKTICLSTQVGCPLACDFCATGKLNFKRNLTVSEIVGQAYYIAKEHPEVSNLVYMGMGEPFLNYDNVVKSIRIFLTDEGPNFGQRRITVSTSGIPDKIMAFANEDFQVRLAVSLNSADGQLRSKLMPVNKKYSLDKLMAAIKYYINTSDRRVTLEYVLLDGINDGEKDADKLVRLVRHLNVTVNLIVFNQTGLKYKPSRRSAIEKFLKFLESENITATVRRGRGEDIAAACGQLAACK